METDTHDITLTDEQARRLVKGLFSTCEACGRVRLLDDLDVQSADFSAAYNLPAGTAQRNVNSCADSLACYAAAGDILAAFIERQGLHPHDCGVSR